ncbi:helix-turn-helix domain-containing protein [Sphingobacterium siyangense]|jgi:AraC-like DNA-binding protein|uniref:helix-turn-helix domain-containing protein n=1 Tax=Sphingobacterium siyangense TaxID=459529 RepID=UPI0028AA5DCC|nr:helix-turn-helix domain-containing protein [Sphingobacterium siyangense]
MMKNKNYEIEHFEYFQELRGTKEEILYFKTERQMYRKEPIGLDFFSFLLFERGGGTHTIDGVAYEINGKQLHIVFPGQLHHWDIWAGTKSHTVFVSGRLFKAFENFFIYPIEYCKKNPVMNLSTRIFQEMLREFRGIDRELAFKQGMKEIIFSKFRIIALMFNREVLGKLKRKKKGKLEPLLTRFSLLLLAFCREHRSVKYYADKLGVSANYLNIFCRKHLDMNANAFIAKEVVNVIMSELLSTDKSIKQVAVDLNFNDLASFSNYFKRHNGLSPRQFLAHSGMQEVEE